jgi:CheY-like chemotaxis protein
LDTKPLALIIEDHEDQSLVFTTALEQVGYQTEVVMDGAVAQQRLTEIVPDIIILDLHIPGIRGDTLLTQIRGDQRLAHTRVLLATADASMADSLRSQADLVLLKPISFSQLSMLASRFNTNF